MIYLIDANILITAYNNYYSAEMVPEYWRWLLHMSSMGKVKMPMEIGGEILKGTKGDFLRGWLNTHKEDLILKTQVETHIVREVIDCYGSLRDDQIANIEKDAFLIAYAHSAKDKYCIVTTEISKPKRVKQNRKIPDVCNDLNIRWLDPFKFNKELQFTTSWEKFLSPAPEDEGYLLETITS
jgi:hypothetical protein